MPMHPPHFEEGNRDFSFLELLHAQNRTNEEKFNAFLKSLRAKHVAQFLETLGWDVVRIPRTYSTCEDAQPRVHRKPDQYLYRLPSDEKDSIRARAIEDPDSKEPQWCQDLSQLHMADCIRAIKSETNLSWEAIVGGIEMAGEELTEQ